MNDLFDFQTEGAFEAIQPAKRYGAGIADPPWAERGGGQIKRGADRHYGLMSTKDICDLPVREIFLDDSHLYLWVTNNFLPAGLQVMEAWGFRYVTNLAWGKVADPVAHRDPWPPRIQQGLGQYFRGSHELLLFGVRGQPPYRTTPEGKRAQHPSLVLEPRTEHSRKPEIFHHIVEKVSAGPYVELFARRAAPGWDVWGNEVASDLKVATP